MMYVALVCLGKSCATWKDFTSFLMFRCSRVLSVTFLEIFEDISMSFRVD